MRSLGQKQNQAASRSTLNSRTNSTRSISHRSNRSFSRLFSSPRLLIQPKLSVENSAGPGEQEADSIAERIMRGPVRAVSKGDSSQIVQTKRIASADMGQTSAPQIVHDALRSSGQPLDSATRNFMETRFGHQFGDVRIHADAQANESAQSLQAEAYTVGSRVFFSAGRYQPATNSGRQLLAHELVHVLQQRSSAQVVSRKPKTSATPKPKPQKFSIAGTGFQALADATGKTVTISPTGKSADGWTFTAAGTNAFTASRSPKNFNYVHAGGKTDQIDQKTTVHAAPNMPVKVDPVMAVMGNLTFELTLNGKQAAKLKKETVFAASIERIDVTMPIAGLTPADGDLIELGLGGGAYVWSTVQVAPPPVAPSTPPATGNPSTGTNPNPSSSANNPAPATTDQSQQPAAPQTPSGVPTTVTPPPPTQVAGYFDIGSFVTYKKTTGFTSHSLPDAQRVKVFEDLKNSKDPARKITAEEATAFETVSLIEHDLAGVQNYDSGILSFGVAQWTIHSDLPRLLLKVPAPIFDRYLGRYGLAVGKPVRALDSFAAKFIANAKERQRFGVRNSTEGGLFLNKKDVVTDKMLEAAKKVLPTFDSLLTQLNTAKSDLSSKDKTKISDAKKVIDAGLVSLKGLPGASANKDSAKQADALIKAATDARAAAKDMVDNCVSEEVLRGAEWVLRFEMLGQDPGGQDAEVAQMRETLAKTLAFTESGVPYSLLLRSKRARSALLSSYFNTPVGTQNGMKKAVKEYRDKKVAEVKKAEADAAAAAAKAGKPAPKPTPPLAKDWEDFPWDVTDTKRWAFYTAAETKAFEDIAVVKVTAPTTDPDRRRKILDKIPD